MKKILVVLISVLLSLTGCASMEASIPEVDASQVTNSEAQYEVRMLDVHQGLCIVIKTGDKYIVYDGGGRTTSSYVVSYMKEHNITDIECMIVSHYDEDHIAGLIGVLNTVNVKQVISPNYETDSNVYRSFRAAVSKSNAKEIHPNVGDKFKVSNTEIEILGPKSYTNEDENNNSIVAQITNGQFKTLVTGDAGYESESEMVETCSHLKSDLYIVGHHGSSHSTCYKFLREILPTYSFISVGAGNSYGHPHEETLSRLSDAGSKIYRTDQQGEVTLYYDGEKVWLNQQKSVQEEKQISSEPVEYQYILNNSTKKFHRADCNSVNKIAEYNKEYSKSTREALIEQGYTPCGNCRP